MIDFSNVRIEKICTHFVGNPLREEELQLSSDEFVPDKDFSRNLMDIFIPCFKDANEQYIFNHPTEIDLNPVLKYAKQISQKKNFCVNSQNIAKILYDNSTHHNIKSGEIIVVLFSNIQLESISFNGIGLFKPESKQNFLNLKNSGNSYLYAFQEGITNKNIDKAALVLISKNETEKVFLYNKASTNEDVKFWKNDFLNVIEANTDFSDTKNFIGLCKEFITKRYTEDFEVNKADQIDLINRSMDYLKNHDEIEIEEFKKNVFYHSSIIKSFDNFKDEYESNNNIDIHDKIEISKAAVKKGNRALKSILKLDKNFDIYIHGNRDLIEQGFDEKTGKKFYKIYFDVES